MFARLFRWKEAKLKPSEVEYQEWKQFQREINESWKVVHRRTLLRTPFFRQILTHVELHECLLAEQILLKVEEINETSENSEESLARVTELRDAMDQSERQLFTKINNIAAVYIRKVNSKSAEQPTAT
ncbi:unnamed protein product [Bursaphelenchus okinawaensis]|uniref:Uncharacterized protein n=1 Tax=Bursaphelenchus okinawaensis TaxID=465554 RepID=A0A811K9S3_9BILA|nr:unnamed protein product [Bursaphelenchus okinawaensis]CAG9097706.1 unnamed protein product [Bursaphelenchus okinawaensis]